jgi:hypothetical protein
MFRCSVACPTVVDSVDGCAGVAQANVGGEGGSRRADAARRGGSGGGITLGMAALVLLSIHRTTNEWET